MMNQMSQPKGKMPHKPENMSTEGHMVMHQEGGAKSMSMTIKQMEAEHKKDSKMMDK